MITRETEGGAAPSVEHSLIRKLAMSAIFGSSYKEQSTSEKTVKALGRLGLPIVACIATGGIGGVAVGLAYGSTLYGLLTAAGGGALGFGIGVVSNEAILRPCSIERTGGDSCYRDCGTACRICTCIADCCCIKPSREAREARAAAGERTALMHGALTGGMTTGSTGSPGRSRRAPATPAMAVPGSTTTATAPSLQVGSMGL